MTEDQIVRDAWNIPHTFGIAGTVCMALKVINRLSRLATQTERDK